MGDPLEPLFGQSTTLLLESAVLTVCDGPLERLPAWMRAAPLHRIEDVCDRHRGNVQIAQGSTRTDGSTAPDFVGEGGQMGAGALRPSQLLRLGLSVYLFNVMELAPKGRSFLRAVEGELGLGPCMRLGAFVNAPGSGLPLHHDRHDQLLIHLIGEKQFSYIKTRQAEHPRIAVSSSASAPRHFESVYRDGFARPEGDLVTVTLKPGTCVFIPAGTVHQTAGQTDACLSLTTAINAPSRWDLAREALAALVMQSPRWRRPVYGALRSSLEGPEWDEILALLKDVGPLASRLDARALRDAWELNQLTDGDVEAFPSEIDFQQFIRLPGSTARVDRAGDGENVACVIRTPTSAAPVIVQFDREALPILEWILERSAAFELHDLEKTFDDFDLEDIAVFTRQLAQAGLLRPVAGSSLSG